MFLPMIICAILGGIIITVIDIRTGSTPHTILTIAGSVFGALVYMLAALIISTICAFPSNVDKTTTRYISYTQIIVPSDNSYYLGIQDSEGSLSYTYWYRDEKFKSIRNSSVKGIDRYPKVTLIETNEENPHLEVYAYRFNQPYRFFLCGGLLPMDYVFYVPPGKYVFIPNQ